MITFSSMLHQIMERHNLSQSELSSRSGVPQPSISLYLDDSRRPSVDNLIRLVQALAELPGENEDLLLLDFQRARKAELMFIDSAKWAEADKALLSWDGSDA